MSIYVGIWGDFAQGVIQRAPHLRTQVIHDIFYFHTCHFVQSAPLFAKPDSRAFAILINKDHASGFKRGADGGN